MTVCESGIKPRKSVAEQSTQLRTSDGLVQICVCGIALFLSSVLEKVHPHFAVSKTLRAFSPPCVSWHPPPSLSLWAHILIARETIEAALLQTEQHTVTPAGTKCRALSSPCSCSHSQDRHHQLSVTAGYYEPCPWVSQSAS